MARPHQLLQISEQPLLVIGGMAHGDRRNGCWVCRVWWPQLPVISGWMGFAGLPRRHIGLPW